tara:strand:+ start:8317 stop:9156 length:840 start_codon:yes stop_codon:yes gene_type:complete
MRFVIDKSLSEWHKLATTFGSCGIEILLWEPDKVSEIDMFDKMRPDILFYSQNADASVFNYATQGTDIKTVMVGRYKKMDTKIYSPNLVVGDTSVEEIPIIKHQRYLPAITGSRQGNYKKELACDLICFTDEFIGIPEENLQNLLAVLMNHSCRLFGFLRVNVPNYLGVVSDNMKSDLIASAKFCVDPQAKSWGETVISGGMPLVMSAEELKVPTFSNLNDLDSYIRENKKKKHTRLNKIERNLLFKNRNFSDLAIEISNFFGIRNLTNALINNRRNAI